MMAAACSGGAEPDTDPQGRDEATDAFGTPPQSSESWISLKGELYTDQHYSEGSGGCTIGRDGSSYGGANIMLTDYPNTTIISEGVLPRVGKYDPYGECAIPFTLDFPRPATPADKYRVMITGTRDGSTEAGGTSVWYLDFDDFILGRIDLKLS